MSTKRNKMFKIGDKVKVVKPEFKSFEKYIGCTGVIKEYGTNMALDEGYIIEFDKYGRSTVVWFDDELALAFAKSDLKPGMIVEYRDGHKALFMGDRFISNHGEMPINKFDDNLLRSKDSITYFVFSTKTGHGYDIVKVYESEAGNLNKLMEDGYLKLIWERAEVVKEPEIKEPKYKVGDRVRVRSDLKSLIRYDNMAVTGEMAEFKGKVVTISKTNVDSNKKYYRIKEFSCIWSDDMFEGIVDYEEMTVAEIEKKLGYKVKIVDGE